MSKIHLGTAATGEAVYIDIPTLISTRLLVTASSGGGKSETLRRLLEEACGHTQCLVIDPEGEFSTLREKKPFVLVGEGGETTADIRTAALVATRLLELNVSAVCDLYEMRVQDRHEWVRRFLDSMVHAPKALWHPVLVIVDEAHTYAPEKGYGESVALQSMIDLANLGRKRGFALIPATQRLSKLSKNVTEPMQNLLVGRTMFDDQERAGKIFKIRPGAEMRAFSLELERLKDGQFIARGRAFNGDMLKVQVIRGETRPPATGTAMAGLVTPTPAAVRALLPKLADLPKEAERKEQTEEDLRREIADLKRQLAQAPTVDQSQVDAFKRQYSSLEDWAKEIARAADSRKNAMFAAAAKLDEIALDLRLGAGSEEFAPQVGHSPVTVPATQSPIRFVAAKEPKRSQRSDVSLRSGARRMLAALCQWSPAGRTEAQLAAQVQMKRTGGTWAAYKSDLKTAGFLDIRDGLWFATEAGMDYLGADVPMAPASTEEVVRLWGEKLRKGAREMLDVLVARRGRTMSRADLGAAIGMEPSGGTFAAYLSDLKQAGLIVVDSAGVRANAETLLMPAVRQ